MNAAYVSPHRLLIKSYIRCLAVDSLRMGRASEPNVHACIRRIRI